MTSISPVNLSVVIVIVATIKPAIALRFFTVAACRQAVVGHVSVIRGSKAIVAIFPQAGATDTFIIVGTESASVGVTSSYSCSLSGTCCAFKLGLLINTPCVLLVASAACLGSCIVLQIGLCKAANRQYFISLLTLPVISFNGRNQ